MGSGVCSLTTLIEGQEMTVSNLGDCRTVLCSRDGIAEAITTDLTPGREDEQRRIEEKSTRTNIMQRGEDPSCCCLFEQVLATLLRRCQSPEPDLCGPDAIQLQMEIEMQYSVATAQILVYQEGCRSLILLSDLRYLLPGEKLDELYRASLGAYVAASYGTYRFCPSPDGPSVYRVADLGGLGAPFSCGACFVEMCTK